jgi:hypothetical protein
MLWLARILTCMILGVWGFFMIAHLVGDAGASSRALTVWDYGIVSTLIASLIGLGVALRWERLGACLTLLGIAICAVLNWRVLMSPTAVIPVCAIFYLIGSYLRHTTPHSEAAVVQ